MTVARRPYPQTWDDYPIAWATIHWAPQISLRAQEVDVYSVRQKRIVWRSIGIVMAFRRWEEDWVLFPSRLGDYMAEFLHEENTGDI